jgi:hypothetical protein
MREFKKQDTFSHTNDALEKNLFNFLIDLFTKSNQLINITEQHEFDNYRYHKKKMANMTKEQIIDYKKSNPGIIDKEPAMDKLKYIEMQLNKKDMLLEKAKVICLKLDKVFMVIPYTISKIEIRMRNIMINNRHLLDGISHFMNFYLVI